MGRKSKQKKMVEFEEKPWEDRNLPELPEHIIFDILVKVPPDVVYDTCRFVCKEWYRLISRSEFIYENASHQKPGLLMQIPRRVGTANTWWNTSFLQIDNENEFDYKVTNFTTPLMGVIKSSCNGLLLETESRKIRPMLCVNNVLTGSILTLPNCPSGCKHKFLRCGSGLGFNPVTKEYKVVHIYSDSFGFEIFTIGSDHEWRRIPGPFEDLNDRPFDMHQFRWGDPVSINGQVFHWFVESRKYIISMDIRDEKVRRTYLPEVEGGIFKHRYDLVERDGRLSFVHKVSSFQIDIWVLKDFDKQIWSKEHSIVEMSTNYKTLKAFSRPTKDQSGRREERSAPVDREERKDKLPNFLNLLVRATLRNGEVMVLLPKQYSAYTKNILYLYDSKHQEMRQFKFHMKSIGGFVSHRISLVKLRNDQMELSAAMSNLRL